MFLWFEDQALVQMWRAAPTGRCDANLLGCCDPNDAHFEVVFGLTSRVAEGFVKSLFARIGRDLPALEITLSAMVGQCRFNQLKQVSCYAHGILKGAS